jgi:hypothetical protein
MEDVVGEMEDVVGVVGEIHITPWLILVIIIILYQLQLKLPLSILKIPMDLANVY